jgi:hypothetical protein
VRGDEDVAGAAGRSALATSGRVAWLRWSCAAESRQRRRRTSFRTAVVDGEGSTRTLVCARDINARRLAWVNVRARRAERPSSLHSRDQLASRGSVGRSQRSSEDDGAQIVRTRECTARLDEELCRAEARRSLAAEQRRRRRRTSLARRSGRRRSTRMFCGAGAAGQSALGTSTRVAWLSRWLAAEQRFACAFTGTTRLGARVCEGAQTCRAVVGDRDALVACGARAAIEPTAWGARGSVDSGALAAEGLCTCLVGGCALVERGTVEV